MESLLDWYIPKRIIISRPIGEQTIETVEENNGNLLKLLDAGKAPIHIILDARHITKVPTSLLKLSNATSFLKHPAIGWVVAITNDPLIKFIAGMLPQIGSLKHNRVMSEPANCLAFLKEQDQTLDWSIANHDLFPL